MSSQINPDSIFIFSVLDRLMRDHQDNKELFKKLFQQKKEIINLVQTEKIDAEKYKKLMKKACKSEDVLIKECAREDLLKLKDPKSASILFQWFKDMIDSTGLSIEQQQKRYNDFSSSPVKSKVVPMSFIKQTMKQSQIRKTHKNVLKQGDIIQKEVVSLKAADNVLKNCQHLPKTYEEVLNRKMKMISLVNKNMIGGENYKKIIEQYLTKIKNEEVLSDTKLELEELTHFHGGNVKAWFEELLEESKSLLSYQKKTLMQLNPALKSSFFGSNIKATQIQSKPPLPHQQSIKKEQVQDKPNKIEPKVQQKEAQIVKVHSEPVVDKASKIQSKITDQRKLMENKEGKRPSESHIEDKGIKEHENVKETIRSKVPSQVKEGKKGEKGEEIQKEPLRLETVCSFPVLQLLLEQNISNLQMCRQIQERKKAMLEQHKNGVLTAEKYKANLENMKNTSKNQQFLFSLKIELEMLQELHEGNIQSWFNDVIMTEQEVEVEDLISHQNDIEITDLINQDPDPEVAVERPKKEISVVRDKKDLSATEQLFVKQYKDQTSKDQDFFLRKMAAYESWLYLYKKNKVAYDSNERLVHYAKDIRKKIEIDLKKIEQDKSINVQAWAKQLFPPITPEIFYNNQLQNYKAKDIKQMIVNLEKECQDLKNYCGNIKKSANTQNIETAKKEMSEISENISYLKTWPNGKLVPLPIISSETVEKYNLDSNKLHPNQIEVEVVKIEGVSASMVLQVFVQNEEPILAVQIQNGMTFAKSGKCSEQTMAEVMKGKGNHIRVVLLEKGFFGGLSKIEEKEFTESFTRVNRRQWTLNIKGVVIECLVKVQKALQPIITKIEHNTLQKLPAYEYNNFVSDELVKKHLMYSCQSPSEIFE